MTSTPQSNSRAPLPPLAWGFLAVSALLCCLWFVHALGYWEDDAWIHLEFARSLATGHGFAFNGHIVYGDTSPLWVWLLCGFHAVIPDWMHAGKTLTAFGCLFALSGVFFFSRSLVCERLTPKATNLFGATMVLVLVTNPYFGYWAFSGMEALTAAGLVCFGALSVARKQQTSPHFLTGCFIAGIAPLLRPEMSFFSILLGFVLLQRLFTMSADWTRRLTLFLAGLILVVTPCALWARYALHTFGMVVPNTNAAKRAPPTDNVPARLVHLYGFGFPLVLIGLVLLAVWAVWHLRNRSPAGQGIIPLLHAGGWLLFVWTAINSVFYVIDHTWVQTRYIFVTAPVLTIAILALAAQAWPRTYRTMAAFGVLFGAALSGLATWHIIHNKVIGDQGYASLAAFVRTLPPDAPVAIYSIGEVAYLSQHPIIDTGGITRPGIVPYMWDGRNERRLAWLYTQNVKYSLDLDQPVPGATLVYSADVPADGWSLLNAHGDNGKLLLHLWALPPEPPNIKAALPNP